MVSEELEMLISAIKQKAERSIENTNNSKELETWLIAIISDKTEDDRAKLWAIQALGILKSSSAIAPLFSFVEFNDTRLRSAAIQALLDINGQAVVDGFIEKLAHEKQNVRVKAVQALAELKKPEVIQALIAAFSKEIDTEVRSAIAYELGILGDKRAVAPLIGALQDGDIYTSIAALIALGNLGDTQAIPYLKQIMEKLADIENNTETTGVRKKISYPKYLNYLDNLNYGQRRELSEIVENVQAMIEQKQEERDG